MLGYNDYNAFNNTAATINTPSMGLGGLIWIIISLIVALVGCFVVYFLFVKKDNKLSNKFLAWLRKFLSFDTMLIETILKIAYLFAVIFLTLGSFALIGTSFVAFLATLIGGNLMTRVIYELSLIKIMIWKNTNEIKKNLK